MDYVKSKVGPRDTISGRLYLEQPRSRLHQVQSTLCEAVGSFPIGEGRSAEGIRDRDRKRMDTTAVWMNGSGADGKYVDVTVVVRG